MARGWPSAVASTRASAANRPPYSGIPPRSPNGASTTTDWEWSAAIGRSRGQRGPHHAHLRTVRPAQLEHGERGHHDDRGAGMMPHPVHRRAGQQRRRPRSQDGATGPPPGRTTAPGSARTMCRAGSGRPRRRSTSGQNGMNWFVPPTQAWRRGRATAQPATARPAARRRARRHAAIRPHSASTVSITPNIGSPRSMSRLCRSGVGQGGQPVSRPPGASGRTVRAARRRTACRSRRALRPAGRGRRRTCSCDHRDELRAGHDRRGRAPSERPPAGPRPRNGGAARAAAPRPTRMAARTADSWSVSTAAPSAAPRITAARRSPGPGAAAPTASRVIGRNIAPSRDVQVVPVLPGQHRRTGRRSARPRSRRAAWSATAGPPGTSA